MRTRRMNNDVLEILNKDNRVVLSIIEELIDGQMHMKFIGDIGNDVAHEFEDEIMAILSVCNYLHLDFEQVDYIASMALKSLLSIQQMIDEMDDAHMVLYRVSEPVMKIFNESGFSEIIKIENE